MPEQTGSWEQLLAILRELVPPAPVVACPNDGEPLTRGPRGELFCRSDVFTARSASGLYRTARSSPLWTRTVMGGSRAGSPRSRAARGA